jgi:hypothetical protein
VPKLQLELSPFHSPGDESALFAWLSTIAPVTRVHGIGRALCIHVRSTLSEASLGELLALFKRYGANRTQVAQFKQFPVFRRKLASSAYRSAWWFKPAQTAAASKNGAWRHSVARTARLSTGRRKTAG